MENNTKGKWKFDTETILNDHSKILDISTRDKSYSPLFSNIGLTASEDLSGVVALLLHYNRTSRVVWKSFLSFEEEVVRCPSSIDRLIFQKENKRVQLAFCDRDCFVLDAEGLKYITICEEAAEDFKDVWVEKKEDCLIIRGYSCNADGRDPDETVPFIVGIKVIQGSLCEWEGRIIISADDKEKIVVAFAMEILEVSEVRILDELKNVPNSAELAAQMTQSWFRECLNGFQTTVASQREQDVLSEAVKGLLFNAAMAPGYLKDHISAYPSRGTYPCHFLWDTCFQNLALEYFHPRLAKDSLLLFAKCQRVDGKYGQFFCSTWVRPRETQPALVGWAVNRFLENSGDIDRNFADTMFRSLERNNEWWLSQRMTHFGVIFCPHGLETGQDDSPRFDEGPILAVDMNSYLLNQMRVTAKLGKMLGMDKAAGKWNKEADLLAENMIRIFYDAEQNMFFDGDVQSGKRKKLWSASGFLPLWAGVDIGVERTMDMIKSHMLDKTRFWGKIPFPCIAYDEEVYQPEKWWRGPTWMSLAWLLIEILEKYGFEEEYRHVCRTYYRMISEDGNLRELFHSQTGEGLGAYDQGWTAAVYIKLNRIINSCFTGTASPE